MVSTINPDLFADPVPTLAKLRASFATTRDEITALQDGKLATDGDGSAVTVTAAGRPYAAAISDRFGDMPNLKRDFGAKGDMSDDTAALQAAVTACAGKKLFMPKGRYRITAPITSSAPIGLIGEGTGAGPGESDNSNCTQIIASAEFTAGHMISVETKYSCLFENFQVRYQTAMAPRASGAGLYISGTNPNANSRTIVRNINFHSQYVGLEQYLCTDGAVENCTFLAWGRSGFLNGGPTTTEVGPGKIAGNKFFGSGAGTSQYAAIELHSGYATIAQNLIVGARNGIVCDIDRYPSGGIIVALNNIEEQTERGILMQSDGYGATMVFVVNNEFSVFDQAATVLAHVEIQASASSWIDNVIIADNITRSILSDPSSCHYNIQSGTNVMISGNVADNGGAGTFIKVGAQAANVDVLDNKGTDFATLYDLTSECVLRDQRGLAYAALPTCRAGSEVFVTDGGLGTLSAGRFPLTSGGSGAIATRVGSSWFAR